MKKGGDIIKGVDKKRSIKIIERKIDTCLGTITYTVQVDNDIFKYKTNEEISEMIERQLHNGTVKYVLDDIASTEQAFKLMKRRERK